LGATESFELGFAVFVSEFLIEEFAKALRLAKEQGGKTKNALAGI